MKVEIEKNVPVPKVIGPSTAKYPWATMEVGDSFLSHVSKIACLVSARAQAERKTGRKFITRTTPEGVRVWRVA